MAAGKPIVASLNGEAERIITEAECGFVSRAEDIEGLVSCIEALISADKALLGRNSRAYYEKNFQKEIFIKKLLEILAE